MQLYFNNKAGSTFNSQKRLQQEYGYLSKKIQQRLSELGAANNLSQISHLPPTRRHKLYQNREGQWAVDLNGKMRLVFQPYNDPLPTNEAGEIDLTKVTEILILEVTNYHD